MQATRRVWSFVKACSYVFVAGTLGQCATHDGSLMVQVDIHRAVKGAQTTPTGYTRLGDGVCVCADTTTPAKVSTTLSDGFRDIEPECRSLCDAWTECVGYDTFAPYDTGFTWRFWQHSNKCELFYEVGQSASIPFATSGFTGWTTTVAGAGTPPGDRGQGLFYLEDNACPATDSGNILGTGGCKLKESGTMEATPTASPPTITVPPSPAPTSHPSPAPTPSPTSSPASPLGQVKAVGDPHLVNIYGQRFDLLQSGSHTMIHIPKWAHAHKTFLRVDALAERQGGACMDIYIQSLTISGKWVGKHTAGRRHVEGVQYFAKEPMQTNSTRWQKFGGRVSLKVVWGHTKDGVQYLNLLVRNLDHAGSSVGGLLGEDDHTLASRSSPGCKHSIDI